MLSDQGLQRLWYQGQPRWLFILLIPLSGLFYIVVTLRKALYRWKLFTAEHISVPVIVIGNVTVGGTGKTPFVMWLADRLRAKGRRVGIILRGYGGRSAHWPRAVEPHTPTSEVGDEAVLHAARTNAIVVAGPDRVAAAELAVQLGADLVLSDDGLQHYRLARDAEICVLDYQRDVGNGWLLPAGPLREPKSRANAVDLIVRTVRNSLTVSSEHDRADVFSYPRLMNAVSLTSGETRTLASFASDKVHAIAGIGNPEAFFNALRVVGLQVDARALSDHAEVTKSEIEFADDLPVLMTEKDAVKCRAFATARHWYVPLTIEIVTADIAKIDTLIDQVLRSHPRSR